MQDKSFVRAVSLAIAAVCALGASSPGSDGGGRGVISEVQANRVGLSIQWSTQAEAINAEGITSMALAVDEDDATTFFEIKGGRVREVVSQRDVLPSGRAFGSGSEGLQRAREYAEIRREMLQIELNARGIEETVTIEELTLPRTTLYVSNRVGGVQAIDAETGKTLWRTEVGVSSYPTIGLGASPKHVAVCVGSSVYCLDAKTGKLLFERRASHGITNRPVVNEDFIFVPLYDGHVQVFPLDDDGLGYRFLTTRGIPLSSPTLAGSFLGWATDTGTFDVADIEDDARLLYRVRVDSPIMSSAASRKGHFFMASLNGHIYCISQRRQRLVWTAAIGEQVVAAPVPVGESLFVVTTNGKLFKLDMRTGALASGWERPVSNAYSLIGFSEQNLFVQDQIGDLVMLDQQTGSRLGAIGFRGQLKALANFETDRLYVCTPSGLIQCLREIANVNPIFHLDEAMVLDRARRREAAAAEQEGRPAPARPRVEDDDDDPFRDFGNPRRPADEQNRGGGDSSNPFRRGG